MSHHHIKISHKSDDVGVCDLVDTRQVKLHRHEFFVVLMGARLNDLYWKKPMLSSPSNKESPNDRIGFLRLAIMPIASLIHRRIVIVKIIVS